MRATPIGASSTSLAAPSPRRRRAAHRSGRAPIRWAVTHVAIEAVNQTTIEVAKAAVHGTEPESAAGDGSETERVMLGVPLAVQLMLQPDPEIADAAAAALHPEVALDDLGIQCSDAPFETLPRRVRMLALFVARAIDASPRQARWLGAIPFHEFLATRPCPNRSSDVFPRIFAVEPTTSKRDGRRQWTRRCAFVLPRTPSGIFTGKRRRVESERCFQWHSTSKGLSLTAWSPWVATEASRALRKHSTECTLRNAEGRVDLRRSHLAMRLVRGGRIGPDAADFIFDLASGRLAGATIDFLMPSRLRATSAHALARISIEIGESIQVEPKTTFLVGCFDDRFALRKDARTLSMPALGGRTVAAIHQIVESCGTWHGTSLRGSFVHHPTFRLASPTSPSIGSPLGTGGDR